VAGAYGVSLRLAETWRRLGMPGILFPGRGAVQAAKSVRYDPEAVAAWLAGRQQDAPAAARADRGCDGGRSA
jgi:phage terminase Nu1 subunit (DNA packaging protein)